MATFNTPVIPASDQEEANAFWSIAGMGGDTFTVGLVPAEGPPDAPATYYWSSMQFEKYFPTAYPQFKSSFPNGIYLRFTGANAENIQYVNTHLESLGLQRQTHPQ